MTDVYDAGVLVAAERGDREAWADHRVRLESGFVPVTSAPVVSQVSRSSRQVQLRRFLAGCEVAPFGPETAHDVGSLLARAGTNDVVDAHLALLASELGASVVTSDAGDFRHLAAHLPYPIRVIRR